MESVLFDALESAITQHPILVAVTLGTLILVSIRKE